MKTLSIIRPYSQRIRSRISAALKLAGYDTEGAYVIPRGTPDQEVISLLKARPRPHALLIPFHAQEDTNGKPTDGLQLLLQIRAQLPAFAELPVVMPVSQIGRGGYLLRVSALKAHGLGSCLVVFEEELSDPLAIVSRPQAVGF